MSAVQHECSALWVQCIVSAVHDDGCRQANETVVEIEVMGYIREKASQDYHSKHTAS